MGVPGIKHTSFCLVNCLLYNIVLDTIYPRNRRGRTMRNTTRSELSNIFIGLSVLISTTIQLLPLFPFLSYFLIPALALLSMGFYILFTKHKGLEQKLPLIIYLKLNSAIGFASGINCIHISCVRTGSYGIFMLIVGIVLILIPLANFITYRTEPK